MAVLAIPNPTRSFIVDFKLEEVKGKLRHLHIISSKYTIERDNDIINHIVIGVREFLSLGVYIDIHLERHSEHSTNIKIEVRRKVGSFNESHEITYANQHIESVIGMMSSLLSMDYSELKDIEESKDNRIDKRPLYKKKRFIIPTSISIFLILMELLEYLTGS